MCRAKDFLLTTGSGSKETNATSVAPELWHVLVESIDDVLAESTHGTWSGGEQTGTSTVDGVERPVLAMPYPVYSDPVNRLVQALYRAGSIVSFDWGAWRKLHPELGESAFSGGSVADAVRLVTAVVRGERFCDGLILEVLNDGTMVGALRRLRSLDGVRSA